MMDYSKHFDTIRGAVADEIQAIVGQDDLPLYDMVRYHLGFVDVDGKPGRGGGKALRPLFCCLACEAVAGDWRPALGAAAALELTHNFTLVHDDIEDGDLERRHQPTVWARWGLAQGINAGDAVWVLAWQALARAAEQGVPAATVVACSRRLAACCRELTEGQFLDLASEGAAGTELDQYFRIVKGKTAALLSCSFELGALCGGTDAREAGAFAEAGRLLGVAFQMQDDLLGVWGDPGITGKPAGADIQRKKMSLPAVYAFQRLQGAPLQALTQIYKVDGLLSDDQVDQVFSLFEEARVKGGAQQIAREYEDQARAAVQRLPVRAESNDALARLAESLVERTR